MELSHHGRAFYALQITTTASDGTTPIELDAWEASFDGGLTWHNTTVRELDGEDWSTWLLAGEDAEQGSAVAVISRPVAPLIRAIDSPEIVIAEDAPTVRLVEG